MLAARSHVRSRATHVARFHSTTHKFDTLHAIISAADPPGSTDDHEIQDTGPLAGKTIAVKDNIVTRNLPTTAASHVLSGYISPFDATVVRLLRQNGATIDCKTNMDEFGMGSHSQHSAFGAVASPFSRKDKTLSPGGSSGGSAVAVATERSWAALGTDTGGSVRLPAAYCGVVGFKPSYGLLSRWGVIQYANSLDTVGVLARSTADARTVFETLNVYDEQDPTSLPNSVRQRIEAQVHTTSDQHLRIGVPEDYNISELGVAVRSVYGDLLVRLQQEGHRLVPVSLPMTRSALSAYYVLAPAEASSNLAKYDGIRYGHRTGGPDSSPKHGLPLYAQTRGERFGDEVKRRILLGAYTLSSEAIDNYFIQAQKVRRLVQMEFDGVFARQNPLLDFDEAFVGVPEKVDVLLTPTAPDLPPTLEEVEKQSPIGSYMNDVFTVPASLAGLPAISVPVKLGEQARQELDANDVRTVGMQVIGQYGDDEVVLRAAEIFERMQ